jgi:pimeloyl-ACP methyl ester carboxylesterase
MTFGPDSTELLDVGKGSQAVVLMHGWCCQTGDFSAVVEGLSDRYRVLVVDWEDRMRAQGLDGSCEAISRDLASILEERGVRDPICCGHSFGAGLPLCLESMGGVSPKAQIVLENSLLLGDAVRKALHGWETQLTPEAVEKFYATTASTHFFRDDEIGPESERSKKLGC